MSTMFTNHVFEHRSQSSQLMAIFTIPYNTHQINKDVKASMDLDNSVRISNCTFNVGWFPPIAVESGNNRELMMPSCSMAAINWL